jgi:hypothetical protein
VSLAFLAMPHKYYEFESDSLAEQQPPTAMVASTDPGYTCEDSHHVPADAVYLEQRKTSLTQTSALRLSLTKQTSLSSQSRRCSCCHVRKSHPRVAYCFTAAHVGRLRIY